MYIRVHDGISHTLVMYNPINTFTKQSASNIVALLRYTHTHTYIYAHSAGDGSITAEVPEVLCRAVIVLCVRSHS